MAFSTEAQQVLDGTISPGAAHGPAKPGKRPGEAKKAIAAPVRIRFVMCLILKDKQILKSDEFAFC